VRRRTHTGIESIERRPNKAIDPSWTDSWSSRKKGSIGSPIGVRSIKIVAIEVPISSPLSVGLDQLSIALATLVGAQKPEL